MTEKKLFPDYIFESSWEVCNKVGGIYTVLSTRAKTLQEKLPDHIIFIGPDCWKEKSSPYFIPDKKLVLYIIAISPKQSFFLILHPQRKDRLAQLINALMC